MATKGYYCYYETSELHNLWTEMLEIKLKVNPSNAESNPICHLLALLEAHHILHISGLRVKQADEFNHSFPR